MGVRSLTIAEVDDAAGARELEDALGTLMARAGIASGDVAGQVFSDTRADPAETWRTASRSGRRRMLLNWLDAEMANEEGTTMDTIPTRCLDPHDHPRLLVRVTGDDTDTVFHFADGGSAKAADCKLLDTDED